MAILFLLFGLTNTMLEEEVEILLSIKLHEIQLRSQKCLGQSEAGR